MKKSKTMFAIPFCMLVMFACGPAMNKAVGTNPQFVIEREIAGAGIMTAEQLKAASQKSCEVLRQLGPEIQWSHSYVTADKVYCVYTAPSEELIVEHAKLVGIPANTISRVTSVASPATAE